MDFFRKKKTPEHVVKALAAALKEMAASVLDGAADEHKSVELRAEVSKRVSEAKAFIFEEGHGSHHSSSSKEDSSAAAEGRRREIEELSACFIREEIMPSILEQLLLLDFETRKSIATIFVYLLRNNCAGFASDYMPIHHQMLEQMMNGYTSTDAALPCGNMLRECIKLQVLDAGLLIGVDGGLSHALHSLFEDHVFNASFEVAADAFETLSALLTTNKKLVFDTFNPEGDAASLTR
jgi:hypothetical protein